MTITEIRDKILTDDAFVLEEIKKIQYACGLRHVIRYDLERDCEDFTESVAEHTYTMHVIADYFLRLEPSAADFDQTKIKTIITWHDMDEIETGDKISWKKTPEDLANELVAWKATAEKLSAVVRSDISTLINEYEHLETPEAKFVKAIDKLDPLFYLYSENGKKWIQKAGLDFETSEKTKIQYISVFPMMNRFMEVLHTQMQTEKFFPG